MPFLHKSFRSLSVYRKVTKAVMSRMSIRNQHGPQLCRKMYYMAKICGHLTFERLLKWSPVGLRSAAVLREAHTRDPFRFPCVYGKSVLFMMNDERGQILTRIQTAGCFLQGSCFSAGSQCFRDGHNVSFWSFVYPLIIERSRLLNKQTIITDLGLDHHTVRCSDRSWVGSFLRAWVFTMKRFWLHACVLQRNSAYMTQMAFFEEVWMDRNLTRRTEVKKSSLQCATLIRDTYDLEHGLSSTHSYTKHFIFTIILLTGLKSQTKRAMQKTAPGLLCRR